MVTKSSIARDQVKVYVELRKKGDNMACDTSFYDWLVLCRDFTPRTASKYNKMADEFKLWDQFR